MTQGGRLSANVRELLICMTRSEEEHLLSEEETPLKSNGIVNKT